MDKFDDLLNLPGTQREQAWLKERLETLSVRESVILSALLRWQAPANIADTVNLIQSPDTHEICFPAGNHEQLGKWYLCQDRVPEEALPYIDFSQLGARYQETHPGVFIGNCFVEFLSPVSPSYRGNDSALPEDNDWSVKLKLASPAVPEGVWLRLPGCDGKMFNDSDEVVLALDTLQVKSLEDCTLLEVRCILPEMGNLMEQYDSITELVRDGDNLGYILDEQGQGKAHWMEKFAAVLEHENCHTLKFALDISQNLNCYEWIASEGVTKFAANHMQSCGVSKELLRSGCIALKRYAEDLLETSGYLLTADESGYIIRNARQFVRAYSVDKHDASTDLEHSEESLQDILTVTPLLTAVSFHVSPEEAESARQSLAKSLAGRGAEGLRQLQAALEYEDCGRLNEAVEIAANLDSYDFVQIDSFQETAKRELLEKGLDEKMIRCFDFGAYAAIVHDYEDIYCSDSTGLYVHKNNAMPRQEQGGMTMQ